MMRRESHVARALRCAAAVVCALSLAACYEQKQTITLNPDGSGKVFVEMEVAVPTMDAPGRAKPTPLTFGRQVAATLVNTTKGVEFWSDLEIKEAGAGRTRVAAVAYFKDINKLRFDMPLEFQWQPTPDGATFSIQRSRTAVNSGTNLTDAEIAGLVAKSRSQYKDQQLALRTQLAAFMLSVSVELPGTVEDTRLMASDGSKVSMTLDGKKAADALDTFMTDDAALAATFRRGRDTAENDDIMLTSMYGKPGPVSARAKFAADTPPQFDYQTESTVAGLRQGEMFKEAGVDLVPKFVVRDATTAPATAPAPPRP